MKSSFSTPSKHFAITIDISCIVPRRAKISASSSCDILVCCWRWFVGGERGRELVDEEGEKGLGRPIADGEVGKSGRFFWDGRSMERWSIQALPSSQREQRSKA